MPAFPPPASISVCARRAPCAALSTLHTPPRARSPPCLSLLTPRPHSVLTFVAAVTPCERPLDRSVAVSPGRPLFTVIPYRAYSLASRFPRPVTADRIEFDSNDPSTGCFTVVEVIVINLPRPFF